MDEYCRPKILYQDVLQVHVDPLVYLQKVQIIKKELEIINLFEIHSWNCYTYPSIHRSEASSEPSSDSDC